MVDRTLRDRFVVAIKELEARQYAAGLARELFNGPNVDRADEVERQLMRDIDEILRHNAELEALVKAVRDLMPKFYEQHFTLRNAECAPYCPRCHYYGEHEDECVVGTLEKLLEGADG